MDIKKMLGIKESKSFDTFEMGEEAYDAEDYQKAFEIWSKLADEGDASAKFKLACAHYDFIENPMDQNEELGFEIFVQSAELGNNEAMYALGILYQEGDHDFPKSNTNNSREWLIRAAENGSTKAMTEVGVIFLKGLDDQITADAAKMFLTNAHEQGYSKATNALGLFYGDFIKDKSKALKYYFEAAENGYGNSLGNLARHYKNELEVDKHLDRAMNLAKAGAKELFTEAYYGAFKLLECLAEEPYVSSEAQLMLGIRAVHSAKYSFLKIVTGNPVPDPYESEEQELWEQIYSIEQVKAQFLGSDDSLMEAFILTEIKDMESSIMEAMAYFRSAANSENLEAKFILGMLLRLNLLGDDSAFEGVKLIIESSELGWVEAQLQHAIIVDTKEPKTKEAFALFMKSSENGSAVGSFEVARRYDFGSGVEQSCALAAKFYKRSISNQSKINNATLLSHFNLGLMYHQGQGVQKSLEEAYLRVSWASFLSKTNGSLAEEVRDHIQSIEMELTHELGTKKVEELQIIRKDYKEFID